ncbi:hypothetical protein K2X40_01955 [Candidatus Babeliales bacterium]|nr:hypothetical protein [Candidatus Babeliales bacterium]
MKFLRTALLSTILIASLASNNAYAAAQNPEPDQRHHVVDAESDAQLNHYKMAIFFASLQLAQIVLSNSMKTIAKLGSEHCQRTDTIFSNPQLQTIPAAGVFSGIISQMLVGINNTQTCSELEMEFMSAYEGYQFITPLATYLLPVSFALLVLYKLCNLARR